MSKVLSSRIGTSSVNPKLGIHRVLVKRLDRAEIGRELTRIPQNHYAVLQVKRNDDTSDLTKLVIGKLEFGGFNRQKGILTLKVINSLNNERATKALDLFTEHQSREKGFGAEAIRSTIRDPEQTTGYRLLGEVIEIKISSRPEHYSVFSIVSCPPECIPV